MKIVDIYGWGLPKQAAFLENFKNNDSLYNQALALWSKLDFYTIWFIFAFVVLAIACSVLYYGPYNNKPGRHYKIRHWLVWMAVTAVATFTVTLIMGLVVLQSPISKRIGLVLGISVVNMIYSIGVYFVAALLVCNMPFLKTNAYRFLKIGK